MAPRYVIGLTQSEDAYNNADSYFRKFGWSVYLFQEEEGWKEGLRWIIEAAIKGNQEVDAVDFAVICGLRDPELREVLKWPCNWERTRIDSDVGMFYRGQLQTGSGRSVEVVAGCARYMGLPAAACVSTKIIHYFRPKCVIMPGITAGIKGAVKFGDVLVAGPSWDYGSGKITTDESGDVVFKPSSNEIPLRAEVEEKLHKLNEEVDWRSELPEEPSGQVSRSKIKMHVGPVASGVQVIALDTIPRWLEKRNRKVIGIEMETYSMYFAAVNTILPQPNFFSCKVVTDFADEGKDDSFRDWAAQASAEFARVCVMHGEITGDE